MNQRIVFTQPGVAVLEACDTPAIANDQLLIRTRVSLISPGTERAFFLSLPNTTHDYPHYPGYSNIGEVIQCGAGVTNWRVGDRVASAATHAQILAAPAAQCIPVPDGLADEEAAFFNLASI